MLHLRRALSLLCFTSLTFGCSSTIIVGTPPDSDAGSTVTDALSVTDVPGFTNERGTITPVDVPLLTDVGRPFDDARRTCTSTSQCGRNEVCLGMPGCGVPWICTLEPGRLCTDDIARFCGCDGQTFVGSSTCPDRPYQSRGACGTTTPIDGGGPTPTGCVLANGAFCGLGETCRVDECTLCRCTARGLECASNPACRDAGFLRDVPVRPTDTGSCTVRGVTCPVGATCRVSPDVACYCAAPDRPECRVIGTDAGTVPTDTGSGPVTDASLRDVGVPDAGDVCASQDARGDGLCDLFLGVYWMSNRCVGVSGCRCAGADCGRQYMSFVACEEAHAVCRR